MLPFNKRPVRDPRDDAPEAEPSERALPRSSRAVPPPARSQPRVDRFEPEPIRPFLASRSDEEVTTFMPSPTKRPGLPSHGFEETGETATALHHVRPPAPSEPDEEEDNHTQIRHLPRRGRVAPAPVAASQPRPTEPLLVKLDPRLEASLSLSLSGSALDEDHETGASAPDFTLQLGPSPVAPSAPLVAQHSLAHSLSQSQPPFAAQSGAMPIPAQSVPHSFAPVTSAPLVSRSQPLAPGGSPVQQAMPSGPPASMGPPAMQSGPIAALPGLQAQSHAPFVPPGHFSVAPARPLDPPALALSTSRAAPKPTHMWAVALLAVGAAAAVAAFALRGSPTVAAFVDPSQAPGARAAAMAPAGNPQVELAQPANLAPALPAQPAAPTMTAQSVGAQPMPAVNSGPPVAADVATQPAPVAVGVALPAASVEATPKHAVATVANAKPEPKPAAAKAGPRPVAAAAKPEPKVAKPEPKPAVAKAEPKGTKKPPSAAEKEMKDAADALARAQLEQSL